MEWQRSRFGRMLGLGGCIAASMVVLAMVAAPTHARAASPVLEFVAPTSNFPIGFTADGGEVTAALVGYDTVVHCADSEGEGNIVGPRSTLSQYVFTGCETQGGSAGGAQCQSESANPKEIRTGTIEADLVFIDQAKREVGMLLNPGGGVYMDFECGGEPVKAIGPFLSPVSPINAVTNSFTAILTRSGATQTPDEYENALGERRQAIPLGERPGQPLGTTGVELGFEIHPSAPLEIKAVTAAEIEAKQREEEAAAAQKRQEEEAATAAAIKRREEEEARTAQLRRARQRSQALARCRKLPTKQKRVRCVKRVKKKYAAES